MTYKPMNTEEYSRFLNSIPSVREYFSERENLRPSDLADRESRDAIGEAIQASDIILQAALIAAGASADLHSDFYGLGDINYETWKKFKRIVVLPSEDEAHEFISEVWDLEFRGDVAGRWAAEYRRADFYNTLI